VIRPRAATVALTVAAAMTVAAPARAERPDHAEAAGPAPSGPELRAPSSSPSKVKQIVGILEVRVDGVSPTVAERFEQSLEEGLSSGEMQVAPRKRMREMLAGGTWSEGCVFGPCLAEVERQTGAAFVVVAYFQGRGSSYRFVVSLVDTGTGAVRDQVADRCEVCTLTEALDAASLSTIGLVHGAAAAGAPAPRLHRILAPPRRRMVDRRAARRTALFLIGTAVIAGGVGALFLARDRDALGYAGIGAAGTLAVSSTLSFGLSFTLD
jgi:hypothetical protein